MGRSRPGGSTRRSRARRISHGFGARRRISARTFYLGSTRRPRAGAPEVAVAIRCATAVSAVSSSVLKHCSFSRLCAPSIVSRARASCSSEADVDVERHAGCYDGSCAMHSSRAASARRAYAAVRAWCACDARGAQAARAQPKSGHLCTVLPHHTNCDANSSERTRMARHDAAICRSFAERHYTQPT